jgi:hypothetical protein
MWQTRNAYRISVGHSEGKRQPERSWEDNIKRSSEQNSRLLSYHTDFQSYKSHVNVIFMLCKCKANVTQHMG